jgi:hypothetical protein
MMPAPVHDNPPTPVPRSVEGTRGSGPWRLTALIAIVLAAAPLDRLWAQAPAPGAPTEEPLLPDEPDDPTAPPPAPAEAPAPPTEEDPATERIDELEEANEQLREEIELLGEDLRYLEDKVEKNSMISGKVTGYLDFGFFTVAGDGRGIRSDFGHVNFPEYDGVVPDSWVFMGDPLSTAINARGDPANTAESRAVTFDPIGATSSSFIVNVLNLGLFAAVGDDLIFTAKLDVVPRSRDVAEPDGLFLGDFVDLRLAYAEYRVAREWVNLSLFAGKFDSSIGFEYRSQESPSRIEVTPSLICRYTCGYPLGLKARAGFLDDDLVANLAVTNGSHSIEGFPFNNETDANEWKTVAGRLSYRLELEGELELGVSGSFGAQDGQSGEDVYQWLVGADIHYHRQDVVIRGEFVQGNAEGETAPGGFRCGVIQCLEFRGAYGLAGYRVTNLMMPFVRVDWRDALHENGASFVYISELVRGTAGLRLDVNANVIIKGEYTVNRELGRSPQFPNDVFTSALVIKY